MPLSEYVSGPSCLFQASKEYIQSYMVHIGLDPAFPISIEPYPAGSSSVKPGLTPSTTATLQYSSIESLQTLDHGHESIVAFTFRKLFCLKVMCAGVGNASVVVRLGP